MRVLNHLRNNLFRTALAGKGFTPVTRGKGRGMNSVILHTHLPRALKTCKRLILPLNREK